MQTGKPSAPKKLKLDVGEVMAPPSHRKGDSNANSDVCAAALRGGCGLCPAPQGRGRLGALGGRGVLVEGVENTQTRLRACRGAALFPRAAGGSCYWMGCWC